MAFFYTQPPPASRGDVVDGKRKCPVVSAGETGLIPFVGNNEQHQHGAPVSERVSCQEQYQKAFFPWAVLLLCDSQKLSEAFSPRQELHPGANNE